MKVLITGSGGLIGSEAVEYFCHKPNTEVIGIDNNFREYFFGEQGSVLKRIGYLKATYSNYTHYNENICEYDTLVKVFKDFDGFDLIIHTAAQPSHDWAVKDPRADFIVNSNGTMNCLECFRKYSPNAVFIYTSTNKVYGDTPNRLPFMEGGTRWNVIGTHQYTYGIDESMSIDNCLHSIFGANKLAADIMVQEYGKYFKLKTTVFRGGCLTGPNHAGVELHGFLSYLVKCALSKKEYKIFGYKGKQVRDNIHSKDLIAAFDEVYKSPNYGEVYNIGGSNFSNCSIIEAKNMLRDIAGLELKTNYVETPRIGDHKWWISDISKFKRDYPEWKQQYNIRDIIAEIIEKNK